MSEKVAMAVIVLCALAIAARVVLRFDGYAAFTRNASSIDAVYMSSDLGRGVEAWEYECRARYKE